MSSVPAARADDVIVSAEDVELEAATTSEKEADLVRSGLDESFTSKVSGKVPVAVGVPERTPVVAAKVTPPGSLPEVIDHR